MNKQDQEEMQNAMAQFSHIANALMQKEAAKGVAKHIPTDQLFKQLDLSLQDDGMETESFTKALESLALATPYTSGNKFFNQLFGGRKAPAVLGDLLAVMLNNSMYTYKAAGPQVGVEKVVIRKILDIIGWDSESEGTIAPGGSMTNFMALLMARDKANGNAREKGMNTQMRVYTSSESHYSTMKNCSFAGLGRENVVEISSDEDGRMDITELEKAIKADLESGYQPTMINATAGTTVLGVFDNLEELSQTSTKYNLWLHVDGAYCGAVIFSSRYRYLIQGIENVDSFSFNAHKMLGTPLSCSIILTKERKYLYDSFANEANYLYQTDHDEFNLGKISLQCGRRNDGLKLWALWKKIGTKGIEQMVDHQFELADTARAYIRSNSDYTLYSANNSLSVCFNYKDISATELCTLLYEHEQLLVGYGSFKEDEFVRLVTINSNNSKTDILDFFKTLETFVANSKHLFETVQRHAQS